MAEAGISDCQMPRPVSNGLSNMRLCLLASVQCADSYYCCSSFGHFRASGLSNRRGTSDLAAIKGAIFLLCFSPLLRQIMKDAVH